MNYQEAVNKLLSGTLSLEAAQRMFPDRADDLARLVPKQAPAGGQSDQGLPFTRQQLLEGLVLGKFPTEQRASAMAQATGETIGQFGFDQDALMALLRIQSQKEGLPPAPFETTFRSKSDLLQSLVGGQVEPVRRASAAGTLLGREPHPELIRMLLGGRQQ